MIEVMTRREAAEAGRTQYKTGRHCSKGHDAPRFTSTGACVKCAAGYSKAYATKLRRTATARLAGLFTYPSHPGDMAALLAYAQALDLARGVTPWSPPPPPSPLPAVTSPDVAALRLRAFGVK